MSQTSHALTKHAARQHRLKFNEMTKEFPNMNAVHGRIIAILCAMSATFTFTNQSYANVDPTPKAAQMQQLLDCRRIEDRSARVDCYDAAAASHDAAERQGEIVVVERERVIEARRAVFGFSLPAFPSSLLGGETEALNEVETSLERASLVAGQGWTFHLADGSVWRQIDTTPLQFRARAGLPIKIRRAAMGSYLLKVADYPAVRAKRQ
jgi:hypothetical protein